MPINETQLEEVRVWQSYEHTAAKQPRKLSYNHYNAERDGVFQNRTTRLRHCSPVFSHFQEQLGYDYDEDYKIREIEEGANGADEIDEDVQEHLQLIFSVYFERDYYRSRLHQNKTSIGEDENYKNNLLACFKHVFCVMKSSNGTMPWAQNSIMKKMPFPHLFLFVELCLRGMGQVMFQNNPIAGLFILIGLFIQSTRVAVYGIVATISGTLIAYLFGFDDGLKRSGLFGYNSLLCGLAIATFDDPNKHTGYSLAIILMVIVFSCFSSILLVFMGKLLVPYKSPPFTLPFNISVLMYLLAAANISRFETEPVSIPKLPEYDINIDTTITLSGFFAGCIRGIGQVFLADNVISGILVLAGIAICSRISAVVALFGSFVGAAVGVAVGVPGVHVEMGMYGFNPSLTVIAMYMFYAPSLSLLILATISGIMTVVAQQALDTTLQPYGLPVMTLPFCVIALPFVVIQGTSSSFIPIPLTSITVPEDHLKKIRCLRKGFDFLKEALYPENTLHFLKKGSSQSDSRDVLDRTLHYYSKDIHTDETAKVDVDRETHLSYDSDVIHPGLSDQSFDAGNVCLQHLFFCCTTRRTDYSWVYKVASELFETLDTNGTGSLSIDDVTHMLCKVGLDEDSGLRFGTLVMKIVDNNRDHSIGPQEWVQFCLVSVRLKEIPKKISKFIDFVNLEQREVIFIRELNAALDYLGKPSLSETDRDTLFQVLHLENTGNNTERLRIDVIDLINYVTISQVKTMMHEFRRGG